MSENYHALVSPSGSYKWLACPGSLAAESGEKNTSSKFADEGTAAHELAALCLQRNTPAKEWIGTPMLPGFPVTEEMAEFVQMYVDQINGYVEEYKIRGAVSVELYVEQRVPIDQITGEEDAEGTSDAVIIAVWPEGDATCQSSDLKYGKGIEVLAEENPQLKIYAAGAMEKFGLLYDFRDVRLTIHQPRIKTNPSEWECSAEHLNAWIDKVAKPAASDALYLLQTKSTGQYLENLTAGDHCRKAFCLKRGDCKALDAYVVDAVGADFDSISELDVKSNVDSLTASEPEPEIVAFGTLAKKMASLDTIEDWCKQVRARVEHELLMGNQVPGYKLVQGRQGARAWSDSDEAEKTMKSFRLKTDQMYDFKLISPTTAEKLLKENPKRWNKLQSLISRSEGKPHVAPMSDKRPALVITPPTDDFETVATDGSDLL